MQAVFKDGTFGDPLDYDEKLMFELLSQENVEQVKVYFKGAETAEISTLLPKTSPLDMKSIEDLIQKKIDENQGRKDIYDKYFMLTGEKITTGILKCEEYNVPRIEKLSEYMFRIHIQNY